MQNFFVSRRKKARVHQFIEIKLTSLGGGSAEAETNVSLMAQDPGYRADISKFSLQTVLAFASSQSL